MFFDLDSVTLHAAATWQLLVKTVPNLFNIVIIAYDVSVLVLSFSL